jgi:L-aspartate oxidase
VRGTRQPLERVVFDHHWDAVRRLMWDLVGIVRSDERLATAERGLALMGEQIERDYDRFRLTPDLVELRNIAQIARLIVRSARGRRESRGLHYNLDHPRPLPRYAGRDTVLRRRSGAD